MAFVGANTRQNLQTLPSIFEITAAETLDHLLQPAFLKIFDYINVRLPSKYRIHNKVFLLVSFCMQCLYLLKRSASFGESFYGLQRIPSTRSTLSKWQIILSSVFLVLPSYFETKLKRKAANHDIDKYEEYILSSLYGYKVTQGVHILLYLTKYTKSHSFLFKLLKIHLRYPDIHRENDRSTYVLLKLLEIMVFFLQFMQWWYFSNDGKKKLGSGLKNPAPIKLEQQSKIQKGKCPICLMAIANPTACAISGYVYCWKCIMNHMKGQGTCPVTGYAITLDDLIGICDSS